MTKIEVRICGLGGQGVVLAGRVLGRAAVYDGKKVVQTQSYGAEARGSAAKSEVIIADKKIGFPLIRKCDVLVAMSQDALDVNIKDLKEDGVVLIDKDLVKPPRMRAKTYSLPVTEVAESSLKSKMFANVIMLGALTEITSIVSEEAMEKAIVASVRLESAEANLRAFKIGLTLRNQLSETS